MVKLGGDRCPHKVLHATGLESLYVCVACGLTIPVDGFFSSQSVTPAEGSSALPPPEMTGR